MHYNGVNWSVRVGKQTNGLATQLEYCAIDPAYDEYLCPPVVLRWRRVLIRWHGTSGVSEVHDARCLVLAHDVESTESRCESRHLLADRDVDPAQIAVLVLNTHVACNIL